ncbi:MAG: lipid A deacylase LpxR family protein [Nitrospinae bacterium]|nr:lipid A deacylase LpxR family protein [Nitrospinota bacterium]
MNPRFFSPRRVLACLAVLASLAACASEARADGLGGFFGRLLHAPEYEARVIVDNDLNFSDKYYTAGNRLELRAFGSAHSAQGGKPFPGKGGDGGPALVREDVGLATGLEVYTPSDLAASAIVYGDRPYAGWLYVGLFAEKSRSDDDTLERIELDLGCLGACSGADRIHETWHSFTHYIHPEGWKNQISDEVGLVFHYDRRFPKLASGRPTAGLDFDLAPVAGLEAGNIFDRLRLGLNARFGKIGPYFNVENARNLYLLARLGGVLVGYNATLQGGIFNRESPYTTGLKRFVFDGEVAGVLDRGPLSAYVGVNMTGSEMDFQPDRLVDHFFYRFQLAFRF